MARPAPPRLIFQDSALLDPAKQQMLLGQIKHAGGTGIQQDVMWGDVHHGAAGYDLAKYDALVNAARARGLAVRFRLMGTPGYVSKSRPGVDTALSSDTPDPRVMGMFAGDMAKHFAGRVGGYSIWNEPNVKSFLNRNNAAKAYRELYQAGYGAIKQAHPEAKVGFGEITSNDPRQRGQASTLGFLRAVMASGGALHADYAAIHPYQWSNPNRQWQNPDYGGISNLPAVQQTLADLARRGRFTTAKGGRVPLSLSEYGYKHDAQENAATRATWIRRSMKLAQQAGVQDVNMYQLLPSKAGDYWDSSIANAQGRIDPKMLRAIRDARRKGR